VKHKIAYIITRSEIGGAQNHLISLIRHFSKSYDLVLITGSEGYLVDIVDKLPVKPTTYLVSSIDSFNFVHSAFLLKNILKNEQPDLIHAHSTLASISARLAGLLGRTRVLYTIHGWHFANKSPLRKALQIGFEYSFKPLTKYWIAVSKYDFDLGSRFKLFRLNDARCIRNGISDVEPSLRRDNKRPGNDAMFRLVFVGRASHQKNYLEPLNVLSKCRPNVCLTMYIAGSNISELTSEIEMMGLSERCTVIHNDPHSSQNLMHYDAMILTSRYEGMPLSVIEGLRSGLPIVSTDVCGMNELVADDNGYLVKFGDTNEMVSCVESLNDDRELTLSKGRASRSLFIRSYIDTEMLTAIDKFYRQILKVGFK